MIDIGPNLAACMHWVCAAAIAATIGVVFLADSLVCHARQIGDAVATVIHAIKGGAK